jgi:ribosomal protein S18 acetylase RimI-like enzyme
MIREFSIEDKEQLVKIVKQGIIIRDQDINNYITNKDIKIIVYDDNERGLIGFSSFRLWMSDKNKADVDTYVVPSSRRKGIGTLLYNEIMKYTAEINLKFINTRFRVDEDDATLLYKKLGYEKWYGEHDLFYNGEEQPKSNLRFVSYEDKYFEQYVEGQRTSYYEMRKEYDFQPHLCCELDKKKRDELINNKDHTFLLLNNENLIATVAVDDNGFIDGLFVIPSYQGNGYGKIITQFAINKALNNGNSNIELIVVDGNSRAVNLYRSLGFDIEQTTHYYRLFK